MRNGGLRTEQGGVGGHGLAGIVAVEALQVPVLWRAGQALEVVQVPHSLEETRHVETQG